MTTEVIKKSLKEKGIVFTSKMNKAALLKLLSTTSVPSIGVEKKGEH